MQIEQKRNLYSLKDVMTGQFTPLFEQPSDLTAIRQVASMFKSQPSMDPVYFELHRLGEVSDNGELIPNDSITLVCRVSEYSQKLDNFLKGE